MKFGIIGLALALLGGWFWTPGLATQQDSPRQVVDAAIAPLMSKYGIPGMAVGIVYGDRTYVYNYGVASLADKKPVTNETLFEIGSVSKTLTATLVSYAQTKGALRLSDPVKAYLPALQGTPFGNVTLLELGTHTPGGLPLQVPAEVHNDEQLIAYLKKWRPAYPPGTERTYSNVSIGLLGLIAAKSLGKDFTALMDRQLFPQLGMANTYIDVPAAKIPNYAQGYTSDGSPIRVSPGVLDAQAYGEKTTASDFVRFIELNIGRARISPMLDHAIEETHTGYFRATPLTQDLIWEQYAYPVTLSTLLHGNAASMIFNPTPAVRLSPPESPREDVWINKTGSTNGFSTYIAFVPARRIGVVILANKSYPIVDRVSTAYRILTGLTCRCIPGPHRPAAAPK